MKRIASAHRPKMREQGLVVDDLPDEVLVYDLDRHQAHCLNQTAALVWRHCDGHTAPGEIARRLQSQIDISGNEERSEDLVWLALRQLQEQHLLEESISLPPPPSFMSRRQLMRNLGLAAAVAVPVIVSIVSPTPVQAATCIPNGGACNGTIACCSTLPCGSSIANQC